MKTSKRKNRRNKKPLSEMSKEELAIRQMDVANSSDWATENLNSPGFKGTTKTSNKRKIIFRKQKYKQLD
jgi:hypothetical protein